MITVYIDDVYRSSLKLGNNWQFFPILFFGTERISCDEKGVLMPPTVNFRK